MNKKYLSYSLIGTFLFSICVQGDLLDGLRMFGIMLGFGLGMTFLYLLVIELGDECE